MKTTKYPHGTAFVESFTLTLRGAVEGEPCGWGDAKHLKQWLQAELRETVAQAVARYYQCQLHGVSLEVALLPSPVPALDTGLDTLKSVNQSPSKSAKISAESADILPNQPSPNATP